LLNDDDTLTGNALWRQLGWPKNLVRGPWIGKLGLERDQRMSLAIRGDLDPVFGMLGQFRQDHSIQLGCKV